jgi:hypothetical protein
MKKATEKGLTRRSIPSRNRRNDARSKDTSGLEVVLLATYMLGGAQKAIDTEDIAIKAHRLAPGRFSWRKHPDQINLELVRVNLSNAKKSENGKFLIGSGRTGWRFTQRGLKWAQRAMPNLKKMRTDITREQSRSGSIDEQRWRRERSRITATRAWSMWLEGARDISEADAKAIFRIDSYAKGDLLETKITRVRSLFLEDEELGPFLDYLITVLSREGTP